MSGIYGISSSYLPQLLSHQTGLSVTASTAGTFYAIGSAISVPRSGIAVISMTGHISAGVGITGMKLTRGSNTYQYGSINSTSGTYSSMFANYGAYDSYPYFVGTTPTPLFAVGNNSSYTQNYLSGASPSFILPVYSGDSLQFLAANNTANDISYIDDLLVMLI
ncbi:MAG: hypothetical protein QXE05_08370 [Nitrososphaeria archaeon]